MNSRGSPESWRTPVNVWAYERDLAFFTIPSGNWELTEDFMSTTPSDPNSAGRGAEGNCVDAVLISASSVVGKDFSKAFKKVGVPNVSVNAIPRTPSPKQPTQYLSAVSLACS